MDRLLILAVVIASIAIVSAVVRATIGRRRNIERIASEDFAPGTNVVLFTSPYCHGCRQWLDALDGDGVTTTTIDIGSRPQTAATYGISSTPRLVVIDREGTVRGDFAHHTPRRSDLDEIVRLANAG